MKRFLLFLLTLALVLPTLTGVSYAEDTEEIRPYVLLNWGSLNAELFDNVDAAVYIFCKITDGVPEITLSGEADVDKIVADLKGRMDARPKGMRWINFAPPCTYILQEFAEDVLFLEKGVSVLREWLENFLTKYKAAGGLLDGVLLDFEYFDAESWYLNERHYAKNAQIYNEIVDNPMYAEKLRPMLAERGFKFYPTEGGTSEIYSVYPKSGAEYETSRRIWDACTRNLISQYLNEAIYEPVIKYYPEASVNDYTTRDTYAWLKETDEAGAPMYQGGNRYKVGNSSNNNTYSYAPTLSYPHAGGDDYIYRKMPGYNKAIYEDDPYNMAMWDVNLCKYMYASTPEKKITMWFAFYYYNPERPGSTSHSPYYAEAILHMGLLDPDPFFGFIIRNHNGRLTTEEEYNQAFQVSSDILHELTRVVGAADRKPIETPANWNNGYLLSGMTAGGKAYWRITPDTTDGMTLEEFKISKDGQDPKFSINGQTITFPGGKIIEDGEVSEIGTCGYWVQTETDVRPVISNIADRYEQHPSFAENYDQYEIGTKLENAVVRPEMTWEIWKMADSVAEIVADPANSENKMLGINGLVSLKNVRMPQNLTAGDEYAKQQMWEVTFILPEGMNTDAEFRLFNISAEDNTSDTGLRIQGGKVYYDKAGEAVEIPGLTLEAGKRYTAKREVDFRKEGAYTSTYRIYAGKTLVGEVKDIPMAKISLPVNSISISCNNVIGDPILLDDYKLYPVGLTAQFEVYNADTGILLPDQTAAREGNVAYRLSWLNGSDNGEMATVMAAYYDADGNLTGEEPVKILEMLPGWDGVVTGIVESGEEGQSVRLYLKTGPIETDQTDDPKDIDLTLIIGIILGAAVVITAAAVFLILKKKK